MSDDIKKMLDLLDAMTPKFHAPSDGLGRYLGDGTTHVLRTVPLANALRELIALREKMVAQQARIFRVTRCVPTVMDREDEYDLSALAEHDAKVLEDAAGKFDGSIGYNPICPNSFTGEWDIPGELRYMAAERRAKG